MRKLVALAVVIAASLAAIAPAVSQEPPGEQGGITGVVTDVSGATVLVEENPDERSGSDKASVEITPDTEISRREGQDQIPATPEDLEAGQLVEATFSGPVAESYPVQATAGSVVILEDATGGATNADAPGIADGLPGTGGTVIIVGAGALLGGILLAARWIAG